MKKLTLILILFPLLAFSQLKPNQGDLMKSFKTEMGFLGKNIKKVEKISARYARKYNGETKTYIGFKGIKIVESSWVTKKGKYHLHRWYFFDGPYCDGYQYLTNNDSHYSLLAKSFEYASDKYYGNGDIKKARERFRYSIYDISSLKTYYSIKNRVFVAFGGKHVSEGDDIYKIEFYRARF